MLYAVFEDGMSQKKLSWGVPSTVEEMTRDTDDNAVTVLDLSNPTDLALIKQAGYDVLDFSTSVHSTDSNEGYSDSYSIDTDDTDIDPEIYRAALKSAESGSLVPLLKKELKYRIQNKRLKAGKDILKLETEKSRSANQLTPEEEERRLRRREMNKLAAQKCRSKRRQQADVLESESDSLEMSNDSLKDEIEKLQAEKEMLENMLRTHDICPRTCNTRLSASSEDSVPMDFKLPIYENTSEVDEFGVELEVEIGNSPPVSPFYIDVVHIP